MSDLPGGPRDKAGRSGDEHRREARSPIEEAIFAAGSYVVPSENLRPRTLEAARELVQDRQRIRKIEGYLVLLLAFGAITMPLANRLKAWQDSHRSPTSAEIQERLLKLSHQSPDDRHWGTYEAYREIRNGQATRFGSVLGQH